MEEYNPNFKLEQKIRRSGEKLRVGIKKGVVVTKKVITETKKFGKAFGEGVQKLGDEFNKQGKQMGRGNIKKQSPYDGFPSNSFSIMPSGSSMFGQPTTKRLGVKPRKKRSSHKRGSSKSKS